MERTLGSPPVALALAAALTAACVAPAPAGSDPAELSTADGQAAPGDSVAADGEAGGAVGDAAGGAASAAEDGADPSAAAADASEEESVDAAQDEDERPTDPELRDRASRVLDAWHRAASELDQEGYLGLLAPDVVFMGTDRTERWDLAAFRDYVEFNFGEGRGWTILPSERHVHLGPGGDVAWFDEQLTHDSYGELRGTGVLRWDPDEDDWRIVHYSMTFTVPNEVARAVTDLIRARTR